MQPHPRGPGGREADSRGGREARGGEKQDVKCLLDEEVGWWRMFVCVFRVGGESYAENFFFSDDN